MDEVFMQRCLELARYGAGSVAPNPMVGAVVVCDGEVTGEGYHRFYGGPHAEVYAIAAASQSQKLHRSTLYVSLEPCVHHGKTPPCADLIIQSGIRRVVLAQTDPNPIVSGKGSAKLRDAGIEVVQGVLEREARHMNRRFNTFHESKRPVVILKWAQTADGFIDISRLYRKENGPYWISQPETRKLVHKWRGEEQAIMVGANTVNNDNPLLTARDYAGQNPLRVVISRKGTVRRDATLFTDDLPTLVLTQSEMQFTSAEVDVVQIADRPLHVAALEILASRGIQSVMVEGGSTLLQSFIDNQLWDEARIITSPESIPPDAGGSKAPEIRGQLSEKFTYAGDLIRILTPSHI